MFGKLKKWHGGLSTVSKVAVWAVAAFMGASVVSAAASTTPQPQNEPATSQTQQDNKSPVVAKKTVTETADVAFTKTTVDDANLASGQTQIRTAGVNGVKTFTYEVTYEDGKEKDKKLVKEEVTTSAVTEVLAVGTKVAYVAPRPSCDPNYSGACVPIASDVDCAGGSGNGPAYVGGPVYVVGTDIYGLDKDGDGVGCE